MSREDHAAFDRRNTENSTLHHDCAQRVGAQAGVHLYISMLSDAERRQRSVQGMAWARDFTWERCLRQTGDVFRVLAAH